MEKATKNQKSIACLIFLFAGFTLAAIAGCNVNVPFVDTPPGAVKDLKADPGDGYVTLSWINPDDEDLIKVVIASSANTLLASKPAYRGTKGEHVVSGLNNGDRYVFEVYAENGFKTQSSPVSVVTTPVSKQEPGQVYNVKVKGRNRGVTLSWHNPEIGEDLESIKVFYRESPPPPPATPGNWLPAAEYDSVSGGDLHTLDIDDLTNGLEYQFKITAFNTSSEATGLSSSKEDIYRKPEIFKPDVKVTGDIHNDLGRVTIEFDWPDSRGIRYFDSQDSHPDQFMVTRYRKPPDSSSYQTGVTETYPINDNSTKSQSEVITGLFADGSEYKIEVKAKTTQPNVPSSPNNLSESQTQTFFVTPGDITPPGKVQNLSFTALSQAAALSWINPVDKDLENLMLWVVKTSSGSTPSGIGSQDATGGSGSAGNPFLLSKFTAKTIITGLKNGTSYAFKIKTIDTSDIKSDETSVTGAPEVPPVTLTPVDSIIAGDGEAYIRWKDTGKYYAEDQTTTSVEIEVETRKWDGTAWTKLAENTGPENMPNNSIKFSPRPSTSPHTYDSATDIARITRDHLKNGERYKIGVRAIDGEVSSPWTFVSVIPQDETAPKPIEAVSGAPTSDTIAQGSNKSARLNWKNPTRNADNTLISTTSEEDLKLIRIRVKNVDSPPDPDVDFIIKSGTAGSQRTARVPGLTNGRKYRFEVVAIDLSGNESSVFISNTITPSNPPMTINVERAVPRDGLVKFTWVNGDDVPTITNQKIKIYARKPKSSTPDHNVKTIEITSAATHDSAGNHLNLSGGLNPVGPNVTVTDYAIDGLDNDELYEFYFEMHGRISGGGDLASAYVSYSAIPDAAPGPITDIWYRPANQAIELKWRNPGDSDLKSIHITKKKYTPANTLISTETVIISHKNETANTAVRTQTHFFLGLDNGHRYDFYLKIEDQIGNITESGTTANLSAWPLGNPVVLNAPSYGYIKWTNPTHPNITATRFMYRDYAVGGIREPFDNRWSGYRYDLTWLQDGSPSDCLPGTAPRGIPTSGLIGSGSRTKPPMDNTMIPATIAQSGATTLFDWNNYAERMKNDNTHPGGVPGRTLILQTRVEMPAYYYDASGVKYRYTEVVYSEPLSW